MKPTEIKIIKSNEPSIENLTESEQKTFYATLLARVLELHRQNKLLGESLAEKL